MERRGKVGEEVAAEFVPVSMLVEGISTTVLPVHLAFLSVKRVVSIVLFIVIYVDHNHACTGWT